MRTVGLIQARMGSIRLPFKILFPLHGKPIIEWVIKRTQKAKLLNDVFVVLPDTLENNILEYYCNNFNVKTFRGSEEDVLERFYKASLYAKADIIVRICADNPLIDPNEIDNLINFFSSNDCDYAYNHIPFNNYYPDGLGAEIVKFSLLKKLYIKANRKKEREHIFSYILNNSNDFNIKTFNPNSKKLWHPELKFDIDVLSDYTYMQSKMYDININSEELVRIFK